jgi:hypothetical protein
MKRSVTPELLDTDSGTPAEVATAARRESYFTTVFVPQRILAIRMSS